MKKSVLAGLVLFASAMLLFTGGGTAAAQGATDDPGQVAAGEAVFTANCARCHGADGMGTDIGRPLIDIASQGDRGRHFTSVSEGRGGMPAFGDRLSVEEIDSAISYVRLTFVSAADTTDDDAGAADDAAAQPTELAVTGAETPIVALGGAALIAAGALMVFASRRQEDEFKNVH